MDRGESAKIMDDIWSSSSLISLAVPLLLSTALIVHLLVGRRNQHRPALPPGPRPWPLLGNLVGLLLLLRYGAVNGENKKRKPQPLHAALASLAKSHGPLLYLRLGSQPVVVASSPASAAEVLRSHDRSLSGRRVPACYRTPLYADYGLAWSDPCDARWVSLRSLCRAKLFSPRSLAAGASSREAKAAEMVGFLRDKEGREVLVGEAVFAAVFNMFGSTVFSRDVMGVGGEEGLEGWDLKKHTEEMLQLSNAPNVEDFFPELVGGWDLQGLRGKVEVYMLRLYEVWDGIIGERKKEMEGGKGRKEDLLNLLLRSGIDGLPLKAFITEIFQAGSDTTTTSIEWTMAELIRNPSVMKRVKHELDQSMAGKDQIPLNESHLLHLPYLQACIKESLRLHPPAPLLLPHRAMESCSVMSYTIPKDCTVLLNSWAIGRDPEIWDDPLMFSPERFLGSDMGAVKGMGFEMIPFGSGRRSCPGLVLANRVMSLLIASMAYYFDWSLPDGMQPSDLCMEEKPGLLLYREQPLVLIPKSKRRG